MAIYENVVEFAGRPAVDWEADGGLSDPAATAYRISVNWEETDAGQTWTDRFAAFLDDPGVGEVEALIVGSWAGGPGERGSEAAEEVVQALVAARDRLPKLTALFFGDITSEECEISWIEQTDVNAVFTAYPHLECFRARGGQGLLLGQLQHAKLRHLAIETGGMSRQTYHQVVRAELPQLEHLELWLGDEGYGAEVEIADLDFLLSGAAFPKLTYLGLRDSELADQVAAAVAGSPLLGRLQVLDLSLGNLSDLGAAALAEAPAVRNLSRLDIHHHYCSAAMVQRLEALGIAVDASDAQAGDEGNTGDDRYVAVSE